jgi:hypothetical protein
MTVRRKASELGQLDGPVGLGTPEEERVEQGWDSSLLVRGGREEEGVRVPLGYVGDEEKELKGESGGEEVGRVGEELREQISISAERV